MNIQTNKKMTLSRKQPDYRAAVEGQILYGVARDAMGQAQQIMANDQNREKAAQEAANVAATQAANATGLEARQARDQEQQEQQRARAKQSQQPKMITSDVTQPKNNFVRNALIIGGTSTAAVVGGSIFFPIFHTSLLS